ncbi:MAG: hypothetical protein RMM51_12440, partial [Verrucomicrobiae bacterium]|nr:hypothetical protein [Verrucomicrobiae bacterium]
EIQQASGDRFVLYRCRLRAPEPMKLAALLGYDGPVKLWIDGSERFHDPTGTNPAIPDARVVLFDAAGEHELVIALGTNHGRAWGIFLRSSAVMFPRRICESWCPWRCPS